MATYTFPHVEFTQKALQRRQPVVVESTATRLLAPFVSDRGPTNQLVTIDTFADFVSTFGELDYKKEGQEQILNIGNWLANGGRVLACRLIPSELVYNLYVSNDHYGEDVTEVTGIIDTESISDSITAANSPTRTRFIWKLSESASDAYDPDDYYVDVMYIPSYNTTAGAVTIPELCIAHHYIETTAGEPDGEAVNNPVTKYYYYVLRSASSMDSEKITKLHADASEILLDAGVTEENVTYEGSEKTELAGDINLYITLSNKLKISGGDKSATLKNIDIAPITDTKSEKAAFALGSTTTNQSGDKTEYLEFITEAKYEGTYYNDIVVNLNISVRKNIPYFTILLNKLNPSTNKSEELERFTNLSLDELYIIENTSQYLKYLKVYWVTKGEEEKTTKEQVTESNVVEKTNISNEFKSLVSSQVTITLLGGLNGSSKIQEFLVSNLKQILNKPLETPFDMFIDVGYNEEVKKGLIQLFCADTNDIDAVVRNDAFLCLTTRVFGTIANQDASDAGLVPDETVIIGASTLNNIIELDADELRPESGVIDGVVCDFYNMSLNRNVHKIEDIYSLSEGKEVFVPSTYFLAGLYPFNDAKYGVQFPTAGLTRGVVTGSLWIDELPTKAQKQSYYTSHINYIEKDSRGQYFMSQLPGDVNDTALSKINNTRALLKLKDQLRTSARRYLHEFNDRITKNNLQNTLNTIMSNWIQNRTLSYGNIQLYDSTDNPTLLDEELLVSVQIKFTGTIDIISFNITIE